MVKQFTIMAMFVTKEIILLKKKRAGVGVVVGRGGGFGFQHTSNLTIAGNAAGPGVEPRWRARGRSITYLRDRQTSMPCTKWK